MKMAAYFRLHGIARSDYHGHGDVGGLQRGFCVSLAQWWSCGYSCNVDWENCFADNPRWL